MSEANTNTYILEGDEEAERLKVQHLVCREATNGRLVLAPIDFTKADLRILDSGTSDGTWLLDLKHDTLPGRNHEFVGTDISKERFPPTSTQDLTFCVQDITTPWPKIWNNSFDLVHQRLTLAGAGPKAEAAVNSMCRLVKPGGWIQLAEAEQVIGDDDGPAMRHMLGLMTEVFEGLGTSVELPRKLAGWVGEAGFVNIESTLVPCCLGAKVPNPAFRERSTDAAMVVMNGLTRFARTLPGGLKTMSPEQLDTFVPRLRDELNEQGGYYPLRVVWGQKPGKPS